MPIQKSYTAIELKNNNIISINDYEYELAGDRPTIGQLLSTSSCISNGVTELSTTKGGEPLSHNADAYSSSIDIYGSDILFFDATPDPIYSIVKMYHNGVEYETGGGETYEAGTGIEIDGTIISANVGTGLEIIDDYSAIQGPCPNGFHIPSKYEWEAVKTVWLTLGGGTSDGTNFGIALKLPFAGYRSHLNSDGAHRNSYGRYWSYTSNGDDTADALFFESSHIYPQSTGNCSDGFSIRGFKNSPVIPDNTWTKLYGTSIEAGGIFRSSSLGLISLSSDGTTWITISDKNLGATTVWNSGDTLSENNCGNFYQWGNNYGFIWIGTLTTSSTRVDASNYGPGNYYNSSTFIIRNTSPYFWDSSNNVNLRGGVTGVISNAIINTGVLSVNGQTGDVTVASPDMSNYLAKNNTTAFTPTGDYQPATKKYVDEAYKSGKGISIGQATKNGRQGPAPDGFHVPSTTEWQGVKTIMDGLSLTTGDGWKTNLHMPFSGYRNNSKASINEQNSVGYYWSSTPGAVGSNKAKVTAIATSIIRVGDNYLCANAYSIRCFKDLYVEPTSSWTIIRGTLGSAGIFWDQVNGLISITSNGTTGYTIQDKNLGATTVYNSGDTLSEANCGKYYQWGNNYGFPRTGTVTTSSTQVNASNYGPGNYYSSDTFIIGNNNWDNSNNTDLWGDTTSTYTVDNAITNTGVLSVNGQTGNVTIPESNVLAVTQAEYDALPSEEKNDGKLRIITDATGIDIADKAYVDGLVGNVEALLAAL